ncbi:HAD-IC family P-type ATPase [Streptomyces wuyuanensis]|uniref:Ca2+-transporting ATPase n=1 Tax=Streptomyces wuyuanensis TaxID=1196353 RepID=A0A1H0DDN8_9ACTN|nr:HAD-IC family P-type ATPase [Streptomyces wuyuanensis]SDN68116.1 Ca2+-transporting ATPase [Streptomyces wuyuanensis]
MAGRIKDIGVFTRVAPEHKVTIVHAPSERGHIVAMTGDGVNDAAALRAAHIGVAMGITGTDVAQEAADMVLTDDDFSAIVRTVRECRSIYDNIITFVRIQLSTAIGAILTLLATVVAGLPAERILNAGRLAAITRAGAVMATSTVAVFAIAGHLTDAATAATMASTTFVLYQLFNTLAARSEEGPRPRPPPATQPHPVDLSRRRPHPPGRRRPSPYRPWHPRHRPPQPRPMGDLAGHRFHRGAERTRLARGTDL